MSAGTAIVRRSRPDAGTWLGLPEDTAGTWLGRPEGNAGT
jgi:hypothetical protein